MADEPSESDEEEDFDDDRPSFRNYSGKAKEGNKVTEKSLVIDKNQSIEEQDRPKGEYSVINSRGLKIVFGVEYPLDS